MKRLVFLALFLLFSASSSFALTVPERLVYDISWSGMTAGTAVQEVTQSGDVLHIVSTTRSASWLSHFFPVDDRVESVLKKGNSGSGLGMPRFYRERINEGSTHRHKESRFDERELTVTTKDFRDGGKEKVHKITDRTYDTLSCIYFMRKCDLVVGSSFNIEIYDCKKLWDTEVQVLRKERITTSLGTFNTIVVKPILRFQGMFARTGDVHIWVTDDALRVPVKMTTKVKLGKITATLVGGSYWPEKAQM
ncbi:DUF3108 domain-containing protein [Geomonas sp. RF6]|uniref:DUF3108 domain-containing protein n=1 Tax=Geomonas sp. RF6 TaxID=2897342 RepID=UPI001E2DBE09|nr:DUF3108 domain-containing protein [Geomonas sp. RF6]UFS68667.1 DUF3108 domain-containing protein [Geomonas sp. RF6]